MREFSARVILSLNHTLHLSLYLWVTVHPQNVQLHNVQLQNVQLQNVLLQNVQDTKRPGYKMSSYQKSSCRTSRIQNVQDTKRPIFLNLKTCFKKPDADGRAYLMRSMRWELQVAML
jgi:hypothetical protein